METEFLPNADAPTPMIDDALRKELAALYGAPGRYYHGIGHVKALLELARQFRSALSDPQTVEAAIWFHDAIYDSRAKDNEARSAELARRKLATRASPERVARVAAMIEATADHRIPAFGDPAIRRDAALFLDMDLSILGAEPAAFDAYERAVRREYGWVSEAAWRAGRAAVLKSFLGRRHIFHTAEFRSSFERPARANLARSLAALGNGTDGPPA